MGLSDRRAAVSDRRYFLISTGQLERRFKSFMWTTRELEPPAPGRRHDVASVWFCRRRALNLMRGELLFGQTRGVPGQAEMSTPKTASLATVVAFGETMKTPPSTSAVKLKRATSLLRI